MLVAAEGPAAFEALKDVVQRLLNEGVANDQLLEDLTQIGGLVEPKVKDVVEDVMDLLSGWCAPQARLLPKRDG